jgi:CRP/FNR family cyclic AMP-dependent transcriptional regulator
MPEPHRRYDEGRVTPHPSGTEYKGSRMSLLVRYKGAAGRRLLVETIRRQSIIDGDETIAEQLCSVAVLRKFDDGQKIISHGDHSNDLMLILSGNVRIVINGRSFIARTAGQHVGEMALVDPSATRSADVFSVGRTILAKISEEAFTQIANEHPRLWRLIGMDMGDRLRQLFNLVRPPNDQPIIFIGSSSESLSIAQEIERGLEHDPLTIRIWSDSVFAAGYSIMEGLEAQLIDADFAVLVLSHDDRVISRHDESLAPRDNVVFELGLFVGALTRYRTIMVSPKDVDIKLPTDLLGVVPLNYDTSSELELSARIAPICMALRRLIQKHGPR